MATGASSGVHRKISPESLDLVDWNNAYVELLEYKETKGFSNLLIQPGLLRPILEAGDKAYLADGGVPPRNVLPPSAPSLWPLSCATSRSRSRLRSCAWSEYRRGVLTSRAVVSSRRCCVSLPTVASSPKALGLSEEHVKRIWKGRIWKEGAFRGRDAETSGGHRRTHRAIPYHCVLSPP